MLYNVLRNVVLGLYNKIQQDNTRYNKVAKGVQHFMKHQSYMMLYEML